jgi:murein L,D-transpeptidase YafK
LNKIGISFPPENLVLIGWKEEKILEVWTEKEGINTKLWEYKVLAASGSAGPKLKEGDKQVPEGFYELEYLNPNSSFHLSMKINYPNEFDRQKASEENRSNPGSDIFIHGSKYSIGF